MSHSHHLQQQTRRLRLVVAIAAVVLASTAAVAARHADGHAPTLMFGTCLVLSVFAVACGARALLQLSIVAPQVDAEPAFGGPVDIGTMRTALLTLESRLEYAPVALWRWDGGDPQALNAVARRLLAPGRAVTPNALLAVLQEARAGQRKLVAFDSERGQERGVLAAATLVIAGRQEKVLALMPIESELETQTLEAWRQLVHVLTHEIMNSLTPIASLSRTAAEMVAELDVEPQADLATALDTIARRATHLAEFVASYRSVSQLPAPHLEVFCLQTLFDRLATLVKPGWQARGGSAEFRVEPETLELRADPGQLEQALLNLIQNAADATVDVLKPRVEVTARLARGSSLAIEVRDNGPGVEPGMEARIFTPFFSTRKNGLGVGLALVRNQIHGMGGTVRYSRRVTGGACFVLAF